MTGRIHAANASMRWERVVDSATTIALAAIVAAGLIVLVATGSGSEHTSIGANAGVRAAPGKASTFPVTGGRDDQIVATPDPMSGVTCYTLYRATEHVSEPVGISCVK